MQGGVHVEILLLHHAEKNNKQNENKKHEIGTIDTLTQ